MIVDSHAHLDDPRFDGDRSDVLERAWDNYIRAILTIHCEPEPDRWAVTRALIEEHPYIWAAVGLHPHEARRFDSSVAAYLEERWQHPRVVAVGETGLDYYYMNSPPQAQTEVFRWHIQRARDLDKPLVIHCREAHDEVLDILEQHHHDGLRGVIHCYTGNATTAQRYLDLGFFISFSGIVTFPKAADVQEAARIIPMDRLLVETDCPYLTPVPYRGRRNEPAYVLKVVEVIARLRHMNIGEVKHAVLDNFCRLFRLDLDVDVRATA